MSNTDVKNLHPFWSTGMRMEEFAHSILHFAQLAPKNLECVANVASHYKCEQGWLPFEGNEKINLAWAVYCVSTLVLGQRTKAEAIQAVQTCLGQEKKSCVKALQLALELEPPHVQHCSINEERTQVERQIIKSIVTCLSTLDDKDWATTTRALWDLHVRTQDAAAFKPK